MITFTSHCENPAVQQIVTYLMQRGTGFNISFCKGVATWSVEYADNECLKPVQGYFTSGPTECIKPVVEAHHEAVTAPQERVTFVQPKVEAKATWSRKAGAKSQR